MNEGEKYEILEKIGHGSFGVIRKVRRKQDGQILCRKEISYLKMSQKEKEQLNAEFAILSSLRHPNIVGYYHREHLKSSQDLHLYMEYCGNGDLGKVIRNLALKNEYADENFVWSIFAQLVTALYRCHYGVDPPEPEYNLLGLKNTAKSKQSTGGVMILHRDLKPENVFLGEDNSVKLGDFGLSKIMKSHDFASTYVGTPFYMSPEICAAERYTLKSDIWALGCIIYELCTREPPFNAKTHFQLVQKIKEGRISPLPNSYSNDLKRVISSCLIVNPDRRPDTSALLKIPAVKLMRKEWEVLRISRTIKMQEELAAKKIQEADERVKKLEAEKIQMRQEIESLIRREWEVKAQLEINRLVQNEIDRLQKKFDQEVKQKVDIEVEKLGEIQCQINNHGKTPLSNFSGSSDSSGSTISHSSNSTNEEFEFSSSTDLTEITTHSPEPLKMPKKTTRTPFSRAQTMFAETPMDVEMVEPSPMSIASLSLSPRQNRNRNQKTKFSKSGLNIFAIAASSETRWQPKIASSDTSDDDDDDDDDDIPPVPSPTRARSVQRLSRFENEQSTKNQPKVAQNQRKNSGLSAPGKAANIPSLATTAPGLRLKNSNNALREHSNSPTRRISKIPSSTNLHSHDNTSISPLRKTSLRRATQNDDLNKFVTKSLAIKASNTNVPPRGRTLVELAQARAGGRPINTDINRSPESKALRTGLAINTDKAAVGLVEPTTWDPERDEMPSPFLIRSRAPVRRI
ncbi:G2-specific protein kinase nimA [Erysiphe neolycopersici]|uniref:non-specific serine/threonine protein kinase n=1 Tax=Erysiphe neolycopersici TaxID=212602 RepID=A0A420HRM7_9PEZI|nr:G2-specific protein kinase nimA [Erysiphe neolycopersici]